MSAHGSPGHRAAQYRLSQPMLNPKTLLAFSLIAVLTHQFSAATQRELPGPDAPTRVAEMHQTFEFLLGRAPPPDHWAIRDNTSFTDSWSLIGQGKRNKAYRSRVRLSKEAAPMPVVVKTSHHRNVSWFVTENSHPRSTADWPHFPKVEICLHLEIAWSARGRRVAAAAITNA